MRDLHENNFPCVGFIKFKTVTKLFASLSLF